MGSSWWNSVETVGRINTWVLACAAVLGFLAALCIVASWFTGTRLSALQDLELNHYKKDADVRIAGANEASATANKQAADANERSANLEVEALKLRQQLLWQGPRANLLVGDGLRKLVDALKLFPGQRIDVRHSAATIMVNSKVVMSTPIGDDSLNLAKALVSVLKDAGWNLPPTALITGFQGDGVEIQFLPKSSPKTRAAANALVEALRQAQIGCKGPVLINEIDAKRVGTEVILPALDDDTIILLVLTHP